MLPCHDKFPSCSYLFTSISLNHLQALPFSTPLSLPLDYLRLSYSCLIPPVFFPLQQLPPFRPSPCLADIWLIFLGKILCSVPMVAPPQSAASLATSITKGRNCETLSIGGHPGVNNEHGRARRLRYVQMFC